MLAAVALREAIERLLGAGARDQMAERRGDRRKEGVGVLAEASDDGRERTVVVGVGVNVNLAAEDLRTFPGDSLAIEPACPSTVASCLALVLERFDSWLARPVARGGGLWRAWNGRLWGRDQRSVCRTATLQLTGPWLAVSRTARC